MYAENDEVSTYSINGWIRLRIQGVLVVVVCCKGTIRNPCIREKNVI